VALAVYRDPLAAGIASACGYGGNIAFGFVAGFVVDRVPHSMLMLVCDGARFLLLLLLGMLLSARTLPALPLLYAAVLLVAVFSAAFDAANGGMLPRLVGKVDFARAVTMSQTRDAFIGLVMPAVSAALVVHRPGLPFLVDGLSYLVSFLLIRSIEPPPPPPGTEPSEVTRQRERWWRTATSGMSVLFARRSLGLLVVGSGVLNFGLQVCVYITLYRAVRENETSWAGAILGVQSVGMFAGSLVAKPIFDRFGASTVTAAHALAWACGFAVIASVDRAWVACLVLPAMWLTAPAFRTVVSTRMLDAVPAEALGRATAASGLISTSLAACSQTSAAVASAHGAAPALLVALALLAAGILQASRTPAAVPVADTA
jgi:MFS family permease